MGQKAELFYVDDVVSVCSYYVYVHSIHVYLEKAISIYFCKT